jgi:hypothetical protein
MKHAYLKSILSALMLALFLWLAVGSGLTPNTESTLTHLYGNKYRQKTDYYQDIGSKKLYSQRTVEGNHDEEGRWHGSITIEMKHLISQGNPNYIEEVDMVHGKRHGKAKYTYGNGTFFYSCFEMGKEVNCEKSASLKADNQSAFTILAEEYSWYLFYLNAFSFDNVQVESYLGRIESIIAGDEFDFEEFDDYYDSILEEIEEEEEFSEISVINGGLAYTEGYECLKQLELRLAVIDRYRSEGNSTFNIVKTDYPEFLTTVLTNPELTATENDFERFCNDLDSRMDSLGTLDTEDPFFTDSVDSRFFTAYYNILLENEIINASVPETKSAKTLKTGSIGQLQRYASYLLNRAISEGNPENAAIIVGSLMEEEYYKGDIIRQCVKEAYSGPASGGSDFAGQWEYWFNTGYDDRIKSSFGQAGSNNIPTDGLAAGMHTLHFRFRDDKGLWSVPQSFIFFKGGQQLSGCEYWFNDDYQNKITVAAGAEKFNESFQAGSLANGMHWLHFRFKDELGIYSPLQSHLFWKTGQKLVAYEFWYDDNFSSRTAGRISGVKEKSWIKIVELEAVNFEKISARYKDTGGLWSSVVSLDVPESVSALAIERHQNISLYPNPVAEKLNISYRVETGETVVFKVYDVQGTKIFTENFGHASGIEQIETVDVSHLTNGVYLLVFETGNERSVFKAVINR